MGIWGGLGNLPGLSMGADFVWCLANRFEVGIITIMVLRY